MFLGMQDFDFAQISPKIFSKKFSRVCGCIPNSYGIAFTNFAPYCQVSVYLRFVLMMNF